MVLIRGLRESTTRMMMPKQLSKMPGVFTTFASSRFLNREQVIVELKNAVSALKKQCAEVQAVYLFGSFASGTPTPKSDADLLIISTNENRDEILAIFDSVPVTVDLFIMSPSSFQLKMHAGKGVVGEALRRGIRLL